MRASKPKPKPTAKGTNKAKSTRQNTVKQRTTTPRLTAVQKELNRVQLSHDRGVFMKSLAVVLGILFVFATFTYIHFQFGPTATAYTGLGVFVVIVAFSIALLTMGASKHGAQTIVEGIQATVGVLAANAQVDRYRAATEHEHAKMQRIATDLQARQILQDEKALNDVVNHRVKQLMGQPKQLEVGQDFWSVKADQTIDVWEDEE